MRFGAFAVFMLAASAVSTAAQSPTIVVTVTGLTGDTMTEVNPQFTVRATRAAGGPAISSVSLVIDDTPDFRTPIFERTENADLLVVRLSRPLPHGSQLFWRGIARAGTSEFTGETTGPRASAPWVVLLEPNRPGGSFLTTRRPAFVWRSSAVTTPPGPWRYDVEIINVASRQIQRLPRTTDTTAAAPVELEFNASYRWAVWAVLNATDSVRVESTGTFVIVDERVPRFTLLYQNFPNPFPTLAVPRTCIWFDLHLDAQVTLEVLDLRGNHVRWLIPSGGFGPKLPAGRYGRAVVDGTIGCDPRLTWDGMTDHGRVAHAGVYLLRFRAGPTETIRKMLFRGR